MYRDLHTVDGRNKNFRVWLFTMSFLWFGPDFFLSLGVLKCILSISLTHFHFLKGRTLLTIQGMTQTNQDIGEALSMHVRHHSRCTTNQTVLGYHSCCVGPECPIRMPIGAQQLSFSYSLFLRVFLEVLCVSTSCSKMFVMVGQAFFMLETSFWNSNGWNILEMPLSLLSHMFKLNSFFAVSTSDVIPFLFETDNNPPKSLPVALISFCKDVTLQLNNFLIVNKCFLQLR